LLEAGADVKGLGGKIHGKMALQGAVGNGSIQLAQILLGAGVDINGPAGEVFGMTALQAAVEKGSIEC
jgi:hypothetical protein